MHAPHLHLVSPPRTKTSRSLCLTVTLSDQQSYGLALGRMREIIDYSHMEPIPTKSPPYVRGVVRWQGRCVPVVDLALCLGLCATTATASRTCIILVDGGTDAHGYFETGLLVDAVNTVEDIHATEVEAPAFGGGTRSHFLAGTGKLHGRPLHLVDLDRVLSFGKLPALIAARSEN